MSRRLNFSAGPATLPLEALEQAQAEFLDYQGTGKSILETSHRSPEYDEIHQGVIRRIAELLGAQDEYEVLLMQGGATTQFALVPMNLLRGGEADYAITGAWSQKAFKEAKLFGKPHVAADTSIEGLFTRVPRSDELSRSNEARYLHLTSNNTIFGTQYHEFPESSQPIVADMSSDFLWRPFDIRPFGLIYAGAQKNLGPAGVTIVVIRKDLLAQSADDLPLMMSYKAQAAKQSLLNTPPAFSIYMVSKTLDWITNQGGLAEMERRNRAKAAVLYNTIDEFPDFFRGPVERESRSLMNVVFRLPSEELEKRFVREATERRMIGLKGHRSAGGIRASIYNAAEKAWVEALAQFMRDFVRSHG